MNKELLLKYISGKASPQEEEKVIAWIDADDANLKEFISLRKGYDAFIWQDTNIQRKHVKKTLTLRFFLRSFGRIAAMLVLVMGIGYIISIALSEDVRMQTVYVPAGQRSKVTLSDGTLVWVNGNSSLTFPTRFSSNSREVKLNGEAYFDVVKNSKKQFTVLTPHQSAIKVLGTKFNVKAYEEVDDVITTLVDGKIHFEFTNKLNQNSYISISPGQKLVYHSLDGRTELYSTTGERELSWKDGKIIFRQTPLREALDILSERFGVDFAISEHVPYDDSFSGTFINRNLEQILNFISVSSRIRWRYLNNDGNSGGEQIKIEIFI